MTNVFADVQKEFIEGNTEELIKRDPEVFVLGYGYDGKETFAQAKRKFLAIAGVADTKAARSGRIVGVPSIESEPDPYAVTGLERIARQISRAAGCGTRGAMKSGRALPGHGECGRVAR